LDKHAAAAEVTGLQLLASLLLTDPAIVPEIVVGGPIQEYHL
jgi:hypothetical protein